MFLLTLFVINFTIDMLLFGDVIMEIHAFRLGLIFMTLVPVVKICVQMFHHLLPCQAKTLLGQFYVDLTHCFQLIKYLVWMITSPGILCDIISQHCLHHLFDS